MAKPDNRRFISDCRTIKLENMERFFQILAVILAGIAAYFLWQRNGDGAFVSAVLGAVAFFLSIRFQVKGRLNQRAIENEKAKHKTDTLQEEETDSRIQQ